MSLAGIKTFLKENKIAGYLFTVIRCYYGYRWLMAGYRKIIIDFDVSGFFDKTIFEEGSNVADAVAKGDWGAATWTFIVDSIFIPMAPFLNTLVPWGELAIGIALILGWYRYRVLIGASLFAFTFVLCGVVWPGIHFIAMQMLLAITLNKHEICIDHLFNRDHWITAAS